MKLTVIEAPSKKSRVVDGPEARAILRRVLHEASQSILMPEPPFTGIVRRRVVESLQAGNQIYTGQRDSNGQPTGKGIAISVPPKIIGIRKADGTYEAVGESEENKNAKPND